MAEFQEQFLAGGEVHPAALSGEQPGTSTTKTEFFDALHADARDPMPVDMLCRACGERGGIWRCGAPVKAGDAIALEPSMRVALSADESGHYIYTHLCADAVGVDLPGVGHVRPGQSSPVELRSGREGVVGEVEERDPELVDDVHQMSLTDRLRASIRAQAQSTSHKEEATDGETLEAGDGTRPPDADYRGIARELLGALYIMIGIFGLPIAKTEAAVEVREALESAERAGIVDLFEGGQL